MPDIEFVKYTGHSVDRVRKLLISETDDPENIVIVPNGSFITMDYRPDRIRIWYDPDTRTVSSISRG